MYFLNIRSTFKAIKYGHKIKSKVFYKSLPKEPLQIMENVKISKDSFIGGYSYIGSNAEITRAKIGRFCSIANYVSIGPGEHSFDEISTSSLFYENSWATLTEKEINIGHDCLIGVKATILRGVNVGIGSIVGANSIVTKDVEPFSVVAGSPAKLIRKRFNDKKIQEIFNSKWWDYPLPKAKQILYSLK